MDFLTESLKEIAGISIHWSSDCNMACKYCYIEKDKKCMASYNREIRAALEDGSFAMNIKRVMESKRYDLENISLWGAEPTINYPFFRTFINEMLDYFPNIKTVMFSTNALLGADCIYSNFFVPLLEYAENNQRCLEFELQLSLDGPEEFNDDSRHPGATKTTLETLYNMIDKFPVESKYLSLLIQTKTTLDVSYMKIMNQRGIDCFNWYYQFFNDLEMECHERAQGKPNLKLYIAGTPTLVDPGYHTIDDGRAFTQWLRYLYQVDRSKLPVYDGQPLFNQGIHSAIQFLSCDNVISESFNRWSCSSGKNNVTVDKDGNIFACNRLCKNMAMGKEAMSSAAMKSNTNVNTPDSKYIKKIWSQTAFHTEIVSRMYMADALLIPMALAGQIDAKYATDADARKFLYACFTGIMCHVGIEEDHTKNQFILPTSYAKLFGNGAAEEMLKYYLFEQQRGNARPWQNSAM